MESIFRQLAQMIVSSKYLIALTGAGISVESGIPVFRGAQGLWSKYDPMEYAHIGAFLANPKKVWMMMKELDVIFLKAKPNPAHKALAQLESQGYLKCIITQNVDNLHQDAGTNEVIEYHGNGRRLICLSCGMKYKISDVSLDILPPICNCSGILKPDVIFFGEPIPEGARTRAEREAKLCDLMLVVGTSATVAPASYLPVMARNHGATIVEINTEKTSLTGSIAAYSIQQPASLALASIVREI